MKTRIIQGVTIEDIKKGTSFINLRGQQLRIIHTHSNPNKADIAVLNENVNAIVMQSHQNDPINMQRICEYMNNNEFMRIKK